MNHYATCHEINSMESVGYSWRSGTERSLAIRPTVLKHGTRSTASRIAQRNTHAYSLLIISCFCCLWSATWLVAYSMSITNTFQYFYMWFYTPVFMILTTIIITNKLWLIKDFDKFKFFPTVPQTCMKYGPPDGISRFFYTVVWIFQNKFL